MIHILEGSRRRTAGRVRPIDGLSRADSRDYSSAL
jgi:hypothetical protein